MESLSTIVRPLGWLVLASGMLTVGYVLCRALLLRRAGASPDGAGRLSVAAGVQLVVAALLLFVSLMAQGVAS